MNKLIQGLDKENITKTTTNGDKSFNTTINYNVDLFSLSRNHSQENDMFDVLNKAYNENKDLFFKNIVYMMDIRNGKGDRNNFKETLKFLDVYKDDKEMTIKLLNLIPTLSRWDVIFTLYDTHKDSILKMIKKQLKEDTKNYQNNQPISLLAKWIPTLRRHQQTDSFAKRLCKDLKLQQRDYRKLLSKLRTHLNLTEKLLTNQLDIDFSKIPSIATKRYQNLFLNKELYSQSYKEFLGKVRKGKSKLNTKVLDYKDIVKNQYYNLQDLKYQANKENLEAIKNSIEALDILWDSKEKVGIDNTLVVCDTSGSMTVYDNLFNALGLTYSIASQAKGVWKNKFITFSSAPKWVNLTGNKLSSHIKETPWIIQNTNLDGVFDLLFRTITKHKVPSDDLPKYLLIISDMEFDQGVDYDTSTMERARELFKMFNIPFPKVIYWNLGNGNTYPELSTKNGIVIVSGSNQNVIKDVRNGIQNLLNFKMEDLMIKVLSKYDKYL